MKTLRSALALGITLSLILLSPGGAAWGQVAEIAGRGAPLSGAGSAAAGAINQAAATPALTPGLSLTTLSPAFTAPSAFAPAAATPAAAALAAPAALPAAAAGVSPIQAAVEAPAAAGVPAASAQAGAAQAAPSAKAPAVAPAASALEGLRRELPDFSKFSSGESKGAAAADFLSRVGELFRPARALNSAPASAAADGLRAATASPLSRYRASPSNSPSVSPIERAAPAARTARSAAFPLIAAAATIGLAAAAGITVASPLVTLPLVLVSLLLHEIGHAKVAKALGDPTATNLGRASFNPLTWVKHVDPVLTIVVPLVTYFASGIIFGGAKPVPIDTSYFKHPVRDMAKVAFAGPAVNMALAALGALAYTGAAAAGLAPAVLAALTGFIFINAVLALFNLLPIPPLDGGHILMAVMPSAVARRVQAFYSRIGMLGMLPILVIAVLGGGAIVAAAVALTHLLIGATVALTGVQLASATLPAVAALGMAIGSLKGQPAVAPLAAPAPSSDSAVPGEASGARPVDLVVVFSPNKTLTKDLHLSSVDSRAANYVQAYQSLQSSLLSQLNSVGLSPDVLAAYDATPIASYRRINAATIRVDASKAAEFEAALRAAGHKVFPNDRRRIVIPKPIITEDADPAARSPIGMAENLRITKADSVQAIALKRFGAPDMNPWGKLKAALGLEQPAQPALAVVDSGADTSHPLLKRVKEVKNETAGANVDDIGHGSWVTSMVLNYAPWAKNLTHYKTFQNGGANLDDILKSLTAAANDGNLVISNSWGSDDGDPESPDSVLVKKLASEGHVLVFAAGNAGPGANTIGSPAIVQFKDPATGAIRVVAVAATDRAKKVAFFSSRGPGSPKTAGKDGFAHRPDLAALGYNTEGAWPAALGDADRTDPALGPLKAISGTSMSTPSVAGALALLLIVFGVTTTGVKLDAVVNAVMSTLEKTGLNGVDDEGQGFLNVEAAYETLYKQFNPGGVPPTAVARYRSLLADEKSKSALEAEYPGIAYHAAGPVSRAWMSLTGRAPISADAAEYLRLSDKIRDNDARRKSYMASLTGGAGVREELLEHYYQYVSPEFDADDAAMAALLKRHPNADYEASGPIRRLFMRLTGQGPKS
ncbi:MAG TPA: S8 family serine peptidase [Elusimicrobiota bacterium]|nr:S8 family serine peptidase [Elusimicrobiota bacterium]